MAHHAYVISVKKRLRELRRLLPLRGCFAVIDVSAKTHFTIAARTIL